MSAASPKYSLLFFLFLFIFHLSPGVQAEDMRARSIDVKKTRAMLERKASEELEKAREESRDQQQLILRQKRGLEERLSRLRAQHSRLASQVKDLEEEALKLSEEEKAVSSELDEAAEMVHELVGIARLNAKDIKALIDQNMQSGLFTKDTGFLDAILHDAAFPGMEDVRKMAELLKEEIRQTGWVVVEDGNFVARNGRQTQGRILLVGPFTAAYHSNDETGFLAYSAAGRKFYAISRLPSSGMQSVLEDYMQGESDDVPVDISKGAAVREFTGSPGLIEQIMNGGPVVWPIIALFAAGVFIIIERSIFLLRRRIHANRLLSEIEALVSDGKWERAEELCRKYENRPLARELLSGLKARHFAREEIENVLQEAILAEIPPMERFLSALGMLAAIAPLLGLLGTVTGMIDTFHVITMHGTGNPRLMSSGISEALVTTMLGLSAAIPLLVAHNILSGIVERRITDMEEKGIALINIILKSREA